MVREIKKDELSQLLELYLHLHEDNIPEMSEHLTKTWETICMDKTTILLLKLSTAKLLHPAYV